MTELKHEYYVSLEVAKLLKEAGFDWDTYSAYNKDGVFADNNRSITLWNHFADYYSAPTLDVAQRWLREVKGVDINILVESISNHKQYLVSIWFNISDKSAYDNAVLDNRYNNYEKAKEAGIKKALEMILKKEE